MKTIKKSFCFLLCICMMLSICGCGNDVSGTTKDTLTVAVRSGIYADVIKKCLPGFETKYGIAVEVIEYSEDELHNFLLNDSVNKNGSIDLCMIDGSWVAEFMSGGMLTDLSNLGYSFDDDIISETTSICVSGGDIYIVPYYGNVSVMMFNKNIASELGYGENDFDSLEDVIKYTLLAEEKGYGGFACRCDSENNTVVDFLPVLRCYGGWVVDGNNSPTVNTEEFREAFSRYLFLIDSGRTASKEDIISGLESGEVSVAIGWPGWCSLETDKNIDYIPFPGKISDDDPIFDSNIYGIWTLGIPDNCTDKESAIKLLEYLMDEDVQKESVYYGGIPCRYSILNDPEMLEINPHLNDICDALETGIYRPVTDKWPSFYTILGSKMRSVINGDMNIDDGLLLAQSELEKLMK